MKRILVILFLNIPCMVFSQNTTGYYLSYGEIYKTTDSGISWTLQYDVGNSLNSTDISFVNGIVSSTSNNITNISSKRKLEKLFDILGREKKPQPNIPFIEIYDDGSTEKKIVVY